MDTYESYGMGFASAATRLIGLGNEFSRFNGVSS